MSGTLTGGRKAADTNKKLYGSDYYKRIGAMGGKQGRDGGFAYTVQKADGTIVEVGRERAREAGRLGGMKSRRGPAFVPDKTEFAEGFDAPTWKDKLFKRRAL